MLSFIFILSSLLNQSQTFAAKVVDSKPENVYVTAKGSLPGVASNSYVIDKTGYVEPTNSYNEGGANYWLVTQDPSKNLANTPTVSYDGIVFNLSGVIITTQCSAITATANRTYFVEAGIYTNNWSYYPFAANMSVVGLNKNMLDVQFNRVTTGGATSPDVERLGVSAANVYLANIIFDGQVQNLTTASSRGTAAILISSTAPNFVLENSIIQNVGKDNTATRQNAAILFNYGQDVSHIIDVSINNIRTGTYGTLYTNQVNNLNIRNLKCDYSGSNSYGVRFENNAMTYGNFPNYGVALNGDNSTSGGFIAFQDYRYYPVSASIEDFRYMEFKTTNGSGSGMNAYAYRLWKDIPPSSTSNIVLDRKDNYWIVRQGTSVTVNNQLAYINTVRTLLAVSMLLAAEKIPPVNIKFITGNVDITSFTVPNYGNTPVNIIALRSIDDDYDSIEYCPVAVNAVITLNATNTSNVILHNFDFSTKANRTLASVINGVSINNTLVTDLFDSNYPSIDMLKYSDYAKVVAKMVTAGASSVLSNQFKNSAFTGLLGKVEITNTETKLNIGNTLQLETLHSSPWTISPGLIDNQQALAGDTSIRFYSSDPTIASVNNITGVVTGLSKGAVRIHVKAFDFNNTGEIEKPYDFIDLDITPMLIINLRNMVSFEGGESRSNDSFPDPVMTVTGFIGTDDLDTIVTNASGSYPLKYFLADQFSFYEMTGEVPSGNAADDDKQNTHYAIRAINPNVAKTVTTISGNTYEIQYNDVNNETGKHFFLFVRPTVHITSTPAIQSGESIPPTITAPVVQLDEDTTYTNSAGQLVNPENITLITSDILYAVAPVNQVNRLFSTIASIYASDYSFTPESTIRMSIADKDNGNIMVLQTGKTTVFFPYMTGWTYGNEYKVLHFVEDSNDPANPFDYDVDNPDIYDSTFDAASEYYITKLSTGIRFTVTKFSPFIIAVNIPPTFYTVTSSCDSDGTINPLGAQTVMANSSIGFTFTPNIGNKILAVYIDGVVHQQAAIDGQYTFDDVNSDHTIHVDFGPINQPTHTITSSSGLGGSINPLGAVVVVEGRDKTFTITPDLGYQVAKVTVDGIIVTGSDTGYTFTNVLTDHTIHVTFEPMPIVRYNITSSAGIGGSISPLGATTVDENSNLTFTISTNIGYKILELKVDGVAVTITNTYSFTNIIANHTIDVTFEKLGSPPVTGDNTINYLWLVLIMALVCSSLIVVIFGKSKFH